jgi:hypothetical protein
LTEVNKIKTENDNISLILEQSFRKQKYPNFEHKLNSFSKHLTTGQGQYESE